MRPRSLTDDATPSATSLMAANLIRLWRLTGKDDYRRDVDDLIAAASSSVAANLFATTGLLSALDLRLGATDVVIVRPAGVSADDLIATVRRHWTPNVVLSVHDGAADLPAGHPASGKTSVPGRTTAYVCRGETCSLPVIDRDALEDLLRPAAA